MVIFAMLNHQSVSLIADRLHHVVVATFLIDRKSACSRGNKAQKRRRQAQILILVGGLNPFEKIVKWDTYSEVMGKICSKAPSSPIMHDHNPETSAKKNL